MRKRVVSWLLVILFLFQNVGTPVYAAGSNWENSKSNSSEVAVESTYAEEIDATEMLDTSIAEETETYVEESAIESEEESCEEETEVTTSEEESSIIETEAEETSEASEAEETTTENEEDNSIFSVESDIAEITNLQVEYIGYQNAKISFEVNCDDEASFSGYGGVICSESTFSIDNEYLNWDYYETENSNNSVKRYNLLVKVRPGVELTYTPYIIVENLEDVDELVYYDEALRLKGLEFGELRPKITVQTYVGSAKVELSFENNPHEESFKIKIFYKEQEQTEWNEKSGVEWRDGIGNIYLYDLQASTSYEVYAQIIDKNGTSSSVETDVYEFTTGEDREYTQEQFPDEEFYNWLLYATNSTKLTQSKLDQLYDVSIYQYSDSNMGYCFKKPIKSIEGIQYLTRIEMIDINGHEIEDVSCIEDLTNLRIIDLGSNCLISLPDMSNMEKLTSVEFGSNNIPFEEITKDKFPEALQEYEYWWTKKKQLSGEVEIISVPVCYSVGGKYPVVFGVKNLKDDIIYTYRITIGEEVKEVTRPGDFNGIKSYYENYNCTGAEFEDMDLVAGTYEDVKIEIYDNFDRKVIEKIYDIEMVESYSDIYFDAFTLDTSDIPFEAVIDNNGQNIKKVELIKNGVLYGIDNGDGVVNYIDYDNRYEDYLPDYYSIIRNTISYRGYIDLQSELEYGSYDVQLTFDDESQILMKNVLSVTNQPTINAVQLSYDSIYDQYGEYFYVEVEGSNLDVDTTCIEVLSNNEVVAIVEEVVDSYERFNSQNIVYKMKKNDDIDWNRSYWLEWKIVNNNYPIIDSAKTHHFKYDGLYFSEYNKNMDFRLIWCDSEKDNGTTEIYFNNNKLDGKEVKIEIKDFRENHIASASGTIRGNVIKSDFKDELGNVFCPSDSNSYAFYISNIEMEEIYIEGRSIRVPTIYNIKDMPSVGAEYALYGQDKTYTRIQFNTKVQFPVFLNYYHPSSNEKIASIKITEDMLNSNNVYALSQEDIATLTEGQAYRTDIMSNNGVHRIDRIYSYISCGSTTASVPPTKITLNKAELSLGIGETETLKATISPSNATNKTVSWTSTDTSVATVDSSGKVAAVASGSAFIVARTHNGLNADCKVTVYDSKGEVITIKPGEDYKIQIPEYVNSKKAKFTSEDTSIATVTNAGLVTGISLGTTKITLTSGNVKIDYQVTVTNPLQSIRFEEEKITLEVNENTTNSVIFTPVLTDNDKAISVKVGDNAIASATVVGRTIRINALAQGNTTVTATVGDLQTTCEVTVIAKVSVPDLTGNNVYAFLNKDKTLGELDNQLPSGFDFVEPELVLSKFAGVNEKEFAVTYTDENGRTAESVQTVKFVSAAGINMMVDKTTLEVSEEDFSQVNMSVEWSGYNAPSEIKEDFLQNYEYEISVNKEGIVSIEGTGANYKIKGLKKGNVTLTAVLREKGSIGKDGIILKATANVKVTEEIAKITIGVEGASYNEEKDYYVVNDVTNAAVILEASAEGYTVKWSTSDSAIVKVGTTKDNKTPITIKSNGKVKLTATAKDAAKTSKSIMLYIIDTKPSIDGDVTINKALANGGTMGIYASYGYEIAQYDVQIMKVDNPDESDTRFLIDYNKDKDIYEVCLADANGVKEGKYTVVVKVTADTETGKETYFENVTISVINKTVTYSIKQNKKVNLFYNDEQGNGALSINGKNAVIESVVLEDCDFGYELETGAISFIGDNFENPDKEGTLIITFEGYAPVSKTIKINTENKKPKLKTSASSSVLYPNAGITIAKMQITDSTAGVALYVENANMNQENLETDEYRAYAQGGEVCYVLKESVKDYPKSKKITFKLQMDNWNDEIAVSHTIKSNAATNPEVSLSSKTITLNKNDLLAKYQSGDVTVKVKNATENVVDAIAVSGADKKSITAMNTGMDFAFDDETGKLEVWFNDSRNVNAGTYNYNILAKVADGKLAKTKIKVKVVDKTPASTITVKTKGSIDIIDRKNTAVLCNAKFSNVSGKVVNVRLAGQDAHLFNVTLNESGEVKITAREDVAYITKYGYKLQLVYTLESSDRTYDVVSKAFLIKVKQGKTTVNAKMDSAQLYQAADNAINLNLTAINKIGTELEIREVAIVEAKATKNAFKLTYDDTAKCYKLCVNDVSKLKKNKNYTIKLNVWTKNQADNERPTTVSIKVKVK